MINLQTKEKSSSKFIFPISPESYFLDSFFNVLTKKRFYKHFIIGLTISIPKKN